MFEVGAFSRLLSWLLVNSRLLVVTGDLSHWSSKRHCEGSLWGQSLFGRKIQGQVLSSKVLTDIVWHLAKPALPWIAWIPFSSGKIRTSGKLLLVFSKGLMVWNHKVLFETWWQEGTRQDKNFIHPTVWLLKMLIAHSSYLLFLIECSWRQLEDCLKTAQKLQTTKRLHEVVRIWVRKMKIDSSSLCQMALIAIPWDKKQTHIWGVITVLFLSSLLACGAGWCGWRPPPPRPKLFLPRLSSLPRPSHGQTSAGATSSASSPGLHEPNTR